MNGLIRENTTPGKYVLYPVVHDIAYTGQAIDLSDGVSIYYEDGIDSYTRKRLEENLEDNNIEGSVTDSTDQDSAAILLGINGSGGPCGADEIRRGLQDESVYLCP